MNSLDLLAKEIPFLRAFQFWWGQAYLWGLVDSFPLPRGYLWTYGLEGNAEHQVIADDAGFIVTNMGSNSIEGTSLVGGVYAFNAKDGEMRWEFSASAPITTPARKVSSWVTFIDGNGTLYSVDRHTGDEYWRLDLGKLAESSPVFYRGLLLVSSSDGHLYAYR